MCDYSGGWTKSNEAAWWVGGENPVENSGFMKRGVLFCWRGDAEQGGSFSE
jgi:hypothetical protein